MKKNYGRKIRREAHYKNQRFDRNEKQRQNERRIRERNETKLIQRAMIVRGGRVHE